MRYPSHERTVCIGYLQRMCVRKSSSKGTMAESKDGSEECREEDKDTVDLKDLLSRSLADTIISSDLLAASRTASQDKLDYLTQQLDNYLTWDSLQSTFAGDSIKGYTKGKKEFRLSIEIASDNLHKTAEYFTDLAKRMLWDSKRWDFVKKEGGEVEVVQALYRNFTSKTKYVEYVLMREKENRSSEDEGDSVIIKERSVLLPASTVADIKRVHINACVYKLTQKVDTESRKFVECQALWYVDEGYTSLAEYTRFTNREIEAMVELLDKLLLQ